LHCDHCAARRRPAFGIQLLGWAWREPLLRVLQKCAAITWLYLLAEFDRDLTRPPRQRRVQYLSRLRQLRGIDCRSAAAPPLAGHPYVPGHGRSFGTGNNQGGPQNRS
jgi:hypothetical protein